MALACPLSVLLDAEAKEEYKNYIKGDGEIEITVNGKDYSFTIKDVIIKAEGSGESFILNQSGLLGKMYL